jgi:metallo-beta-lactamase family protein
MDVRVKFLGGAGSVTGSRYLISAGDFKFMLDCGLFQGLKPLRLRNWDEFPVDPASIHAVVISHAHIDHTGYLPKLVREGFNGPIYCTEPTADLMEIMLMDSAKLQEEEAEYARRKGYSKHSRPEPLYTENDAKNTFAHFRTFGYDKRIKIHENIDVVYRNAGHLLGSAIVEVYIKAGAQTKKIVLSGDLGRYEQAILDAPTAIDQADILFIESTYGNKANPFDDPADDLARIANETFDRNGVLVIPAFAIGRTQTLLYYFRRLMQQDKIPDVPVYVDSPMAISATYLFYKYPGYHKMGTDSKELAEKIETNMLVLVKSAAHSKTLNNIKSHAIILSSSGMMTGGRILHHMFHRLRNKRDTFLIAGYQAEGTRGRRLLDHEPTIKIFGEEVPVNCKIEFISSMSGHADKEELFRWMSGFQDKPKITFTVHGESPDIEVYAQSIRDRLGWNVIVPEYMESVTLFDGLDTVAYQEKDPANNK